MNTLRCGPCQRIGPVFVKKSENYQTIKFIKVDVDELDDVAASCNVYVYYFI
jgi:thioredoxin 1